MLRLAFDFIITWRETRTRPNAYEQEVFYRCFRLPEAGEEFKLYSASVIFTILQSRYPAAMRGMTVVRFGKMMSAMGAERMHTEKGNLYKVVLAA